MGCSPAVLGVPNADANMLKSLALFASWELAVVSPSSVDSGFSFVGVVSPLPFAWTPLAVLALELAAAAAAALAGG